MISAERNNVTLSGGAPWGFRLAGGGALPLTINKIRKKSQAHIKGLHEGDAVISINSVPVHDKSQDEALELVEKAGDTMVLEIFRGDSDGLSQIKPKKPIKVASGGGGFTLTATVDDVSNAAIVAVPAQANASSGLVPTSSVDSFDTAESDFGTIQGFTATLDGVSEQSFQCAGANFGSPGFTLTATVDMTSSSNMIDSITAELGDISASSLLSPQMEDFQASSTLSPTMAQPFTDSAGSARSTNRLSPIAPKDRASPKGFTPVAFSPNATSLSPQPPPTSPKPSTPQSKQNLSPKPFFPAQVPAPPVGPKPSSVSSTTNTTTFDDGHTRRKVTKEQHVQRKENGYGVTVVNRQTTSTSTNKGTPSFVKNQASAFSAPQQTTENRRGGHSPFSPSAFTTQQVTATASLNKGNQSPAPVFKPSRFVPGQGKKNIPGLYAPTSPQVEVNVHAMYRDGKENIGPAQPIFQVKNILTEKNKTKGRDIWKANVWLPEQKSGENQSSEKVASVSADDFSPYTSFPVPQVQPGQSLVEKAKNSLKQSHTQQQHDYDDVNGEDLEDRKKLHKLHVFAPPVEIHAMVDSGYHDSPYSPYLPYSADGEPLYDCEDGPSSPDSSVIRRQKKLFADSAFYDAPGNSYPTIGEQMKLCKKIAQSLTSQANRRARGAKMFMRRKRRSSKWIHEGHSEWSSSAGDVANINELDSELSPDEGGSKPLFYFKIPNLKKRISSNEKKMALTQEQFERLRLQSSRCEHKTVSPNTCFDLAADLKASKGRGGRMFEKRKSRAEKYVVDENTAKHAKPRAKLGLNQPIRQEKSPWEAALAHGGNVDAAFSHLTDMERNQKLNQILKYQNPMKKQTTPMPPSMTPMEPCPVQTSLKSDSSAFLLSGKNFNRMARGWAGGGEYPVAENVLHITSPNAHDGPQPSPQSPLHGNFNTKIKAWESPYVASPTTPSQGRRNDQMEPRRPQGDVTLRGQRDWRQQERTEPRYDTWAPGRQDESQLRPKSWQSDSNYDANNYGDESEYNVPVDYKFSQSEYPPVAYMQPIIPGTDL